MGGFVTLAAKMIIGAYCCAGEGVELKEIAGHVLRGFLELGRKNQLTTLDGPLTGIAEIGRLVADAISFTYTALGIPLPENSDMLSFYGAGGL